jgi:ATP-dependent exoDNAse (exonuclease V) beta subunit
MNNSVLASGYTHIQLLDHYKSINDTVTRRPEWSYFLKFVEDHPDMKPYRTEWMIFDEDVKLAGSIDMVYENPDGTLSIYDWKRAKEITKDNNWKKYAINPIIGQIPDTNYWHYALQLNTYRHILETKYGKKVTNLCLVRIHPDNPEKTYELLPVPILTKEMNNLFNEIKKKYV